AARARPPARKAVGRPGRPAPDNEAGPVARPPTTRPAREAGPRQRGRPGRLGPDAGRSPRLPHQRGVVVLGPDGLDVLDPAAVVDAVGPLVARAHQVPGLTAVGPVVRLEAVRLLEVGNGGLGAALAVQMLAELELG